jgi:hypothetical protein
MIPDEFVVIPRTPIYPQIWIEDSFKTGIPVASSINEIFTSLLVKYPPEERGLMWY